MAKTGYEGIPHSYRYEPPPTTPLVHWATLARLQTKQEAHDYWLANKKKPEPIGQRTSNRKGA